LKSIFLSMLLAASLFAAAPAPPAQANIPEGEPVRGIRCDQMEGTAYHIHAHLTVNDHGKPVDIPDDVGRPLFTPCFYWLHTHTPDGIIHVESPVVRTFTLGQFFAIWDEPLSRTRAASAKLRKGEKMTVWLDGRRYGGNPSAIAIAQHTDVVIDVGPPAPKPTPFTQWNGL